MAYTVGDMMQSSKYERIKSLGFEPYRSETHPSYKTKKTPLKSVFQKDKLVKDISTLFDAIPITDGMTLSFHHHLRNGDFVLNLVLKEIKKRKLKNIKLAPSAIFPVHEPLVELIKDGSITHITTNYINGPVAKAVSEGLLRGHLIMDTHGGRPRAIETGDLDIDVAFIAVPAATTYGDGYGAIGKSACGSLGYAESDLLYAKHRVIVTDTLYETLPHIELSGDYVEYVIKIDAIGDPKGIMSGTTKPTKDPIQLKIAKETLKVMEALGMLKDQMSFQTGAGGTSIAVAKLLDAYMENHHIKGSFASGGITGYLVDMLESNKFDKLYDVQCFDLKAVESYHKNSNHLYMSASTYANPNNPNAIVNQLDVVILGATEVDLDFNVNVITDSSGYLMGGSGGHSDTAAGAKVTIITTNLIKSRLPIIKPHVQTITTPGHDVDVIVTERGVAINPNRLDLIEKLNRNHIEITPIDKLYEKAIHMTSRPEDVLKSNQVIGYVRYRDGRIIDLLYKVGESDELSN